DLPGQGRRAERAGQPAAALLGRAAHRLLPRRLLQHRTGGPRAARGLRRDHGGLLGLQPVPRQRPDDADRRDRLRRPPSRRPVVRLRVPVGGGSPCRHGAPGAAGGDALGGPRDVQPDGPARARGGPAV
ncbi:MAG: hypothetical protein AVDCRST_MAG08-485, partial [uncultured Acetobacteraceae bacterium]